MTRYLEFKKPRFIGTATEMIGLTAEITSGASGYSERSRIHRIAIGAALIAQAVKIVRIQRTRFVLTDLNVDLPEGIEFESNARVVSSDPSDGSIVLIIEN